MEILILLVLFVLNGLFSMSETAVVSSRKARLQQWADEHRRGADTALRLTEDPTNFLATIQVGITVIGITQGAFGEAKLSHALAEKLGTWPAAAGYADVLASVIVVGGITVVSLLIGELVPKRIALRSPEAIASRIARPMRMLSRIVHPLVRALSLATAGIAKLLGERRQDEPPVTQEEIEVLMEQGTEAGVFAKHEQALVSRVFRLDDIRVAAAMTPRADVQFLDRDASRDENARRILAAGHSRFPVVRGSLDRVEGFVLARALLEDVLRNRPLDLARDLTKALYVPQTLSLTEVVRAFRQHRQKMALVVNEFGDVQGLVTLNDVMAALVGEIATAHEEGEHDVVERDDGSWLVDGSVSIARFKDVLGIDEPLPEEDVGAYHTAGGFAMAQLERVPRAGDRFSWKALRIEVADMDHNRVDKLIVSRVQA